MHHCIILEQKIGRRPQEHKENTGRIITMSKDYELFDATSDSWHFHVIRENDSSSDCNIRQASNQIGPNFLESDKFFFF